MNALSRPPFLAATHHIIVIGRDAAFRTASLRIPSGLQGHAEAALPSDCSRLTIHFLSFMLGGAGGRRVSIDCHWFYR